MKEETDEKTENDRDTEKDVVPLQFAINPDNDILWRLVKLFRLDVWGSSLLWGPAQDEIRVSALMLAGVGIFETLAWTTLFNTIGHRGEWIINAWTMVAFVFGLCMATIICAFDRGILVTDFSVGRQKKQAGAALRLVFIFCSALITAQALELFLFKDQIAHRLYEETIVAEAVMLNKEINDKETLSKYTPETQTMRVSESLEVGHLEDINQNLERAKKELIDKKDERKNLLTTAQNILWEIQKLDKANSTDPDIQKKLANAQQRYNWAMTQHKEVEKQIEKEQERIKLLEQKRSEAREQAIKHRDGIHDLLDQERINAQREVRDMVEWIMRLSRSDYRTPPENPWTGTPLKIREAGFVDRVIVLQDILNARPPRWPPSQEETQQQVVERFPGIATVRETASLRAKQEAGTRTFIYWTVHLFALFIPLIAFAYKLLMPKELAIYYSTNAQAEAENPLAIKILSIMNAN